MLARSMLKHAMNMQEKTLGLLFDVLIEVSGRLKAAAGRASDAPVAAHESNESEDEELDQDPSDIIHANKVGVLGLSCRTQWPRT